jgi:hypothetical protein
MILQAPHFAADTGTAWVLTRAMIYHSPLLNCTISVPVGFETDLASIPRFFQRILPVNDSHRLAAVLHDYLYSKKGVLSKNTLTREQCDSAFLEAMQVCGVPFVKRHTMHRAVRLGGWMYWNKNNAHL